MRSPLFLSSCLVLIHLTGQFQHGQGATTNDLLSVTELAGIRWDEMETGDGVGSEARFIWPMGIAVNSQGVIYVSDVSSSTIRKIDRDGRVTTVAGKASIFAGVDGPALSARFSGPRAIAFDANDNLYITEDYNYAVRKLDTNGMVTTIAGLFGVSGNQTGTGSVARFNLPRGVVVDASGNLLVADQRNSRICRISPAGVVTNFAAVSAEGVDLDAAGMLFAPNWQQGFIYKISPTGTVRTFSGRFNQEFSPQFQDGPSNVAYYAHPTDVAVAPDGSIFVTEARGHTIRKVSTNGTASTFAGVGLSAGTNDGVGSLARFRGPRALAFTPEGDLVVADSDNSVIRKVAPDGTVTTLAGTAGQFGPVAHGTNDGMGAAARFRNPRGVAIAPDGTVYVADSVQHTIRRIDLQGVVSTFAGTPRLAGLSNGPVASARFNTPVGLAMDANGNLFVSDSVNNQIRKITPAGEVSTFAPAGTNTTTFNRPTGLNFDRSGNLLVADQGNHRIRRLTPDGADTYIIGSGAQGYRNDLYVISSFNFPSSAIEAPDGSILISDTESSVIRRFSLTNFMVTTFAGAYREMSNVDAIGESARFNRPRGMAVTPDGRMLIVDQRNQTIREITMAGEVRTLAGATNSYEPALGIGPAARFMAPDSIAADASGRLVITDVAANHLRLARFVPALPQLEIEIQTTSANLIFSWPTNFGLFRLEGTTNLLNPGSWQEMSGAAGLSGGRMVQTNASSGMSVRFFRLQRMP